uniref:Protein kinase domain-containing protein n=1 Tax=Panagrellus redivivus TaxID=6233 RepID=A0A7E4ZVY8_PANRE
MATESTDNSLDKKGKKDGADRELRSVARRTHAQANRTKARVARELSCVPQNARTTRRAGEDVPMEMNETNEKEEARRLANHLRDIAPFHERWQIVQTINEGTYGVVFAVRDVKTGTMGVIKIAKASSNDSVVNVTANWESFILEKIFKANADASICRLLDHGMLQSFEGIGLEFMVLEFVELKMHQHLSEYSGKARQLRVCQLSIMTLKGIYDLHKEGLLHRDLKPDNMGLLSRDQPIVVIYDLGMARMYTDGEGKARPYRSSVSFRGTVEWASGNALKCREQSRYDDLIAWLYCMVELFDGDPESPQIFPWSSRGRNSKECQYFKSMFCPSKVLLRKCPSAYYAINTYLMTAPRHTTPDYSFLADRCKDAMEEVEPGSTADMSTITKALPPLQNPKSAAGTNDSKDKNNDPNSPAGTVTAEAGTTKENKAAAATAREKEVSIDAATPTKT